MSAPTGTIVVPLSDLLAFTFQKQIVPSHSWAFLDRRRQSARISANQRKSSRDVRKRLLNRTIGVLSLRSASRRIGTDEGSRVQYSASVFGSSVHKVVPAEQLRPRLHTTLVSAGQSSESRQTHKVCVAKVVLHPQVGREVCRFRVVDGARREREIWRRDRFERYDEPSWKRAARRLVVLGQAGAEDASDELGLEEGQVVPRLRRVFEPVYGPS